MSNYTTNAKVSVLLGKSFDASTTPTSTQVDVIIGQITGEIDTILNSIGITSQPTDTNILAMLDKYASFGSAGITGMTYFRNANDVNSSNAEWYYSKYEAFLKKLMENPELLGIITGSTQLVVSNQVLDGTYTESEQNDILLSSEDYEV